MLPMQDEILVAFMRADRLAAAERSRLLRTCVACVRRSTARLALFQFGRLLVSAGERLESLGGKGSRPRTADLVPGARI